MARLEALALALPETERVNIEQWGDHPTFRVRGKVFIFSDTDATSISVKLPKDEAAAVVATREFAEPAGYGMGRHGWVALNLGSDGVDWAEVAELVETSYRLIAPKRLVAQLDSRA
ncbi:MmcQ/YjbR family DNA-binding protein [Skermania sp. ID1734]|nr:MmcQ/YjbR family DNA-binding protein [Skermania sp. ID1734]